MSDTSGAVPAIPPQARDAITAGSGGEEIKHRGAVGETGATISFSAPAHSISAPTTLQWHVISEEELCMLVARGKDTSLEWSLAMGGAGVGAFPSFVKVVSEIAKGAPLSVGDSLMAVGSVVLLALAGMCYRYYRLNQKSTEQIEQQIRSRTPKAGPQLVS